MAAAPPANASRKLSVNNRRITRQRPAPTANRTPISEARPAPRASSILAILEHAINSTSPLAPSAVAIVIQNDFVLPALKAGATLMNVFGPGPSAARSWFCNLANSACASATVLPGFRRA